ncbi:SWIM zinc finger family protein [Streptomyces sp. RY43-2]|uniref:SWIM zinc finger family protein n=1 Tax=Streptomyces macrolidinus TaxID=2952607 RepID=A0ABT0ZM95_9ACTN|nr:SWIM zinc finger family protein [Streptomyces macrolidinus]MCN9244658.1 SWIM zinc finger family protein [Streptomyces macrolidinus]
MNGAESTTSARPADEARRALRAARERESASAEGAEGAEGDGPEGTASGADVRPESGPTVRPGDAARAALRRANAERRGGDAREADRVTVDAAAREAAPMTVDAAAPETVAETVPATRPGDIAREALRAARKEKEAGRRPPATTPNPSSGSRAASGTAEPSAGPSELAGRAERLGPPGSARPSRSVRPSGSARPTVARTLRPSTRTRVHSGRVQDVRELLADTFELPASMASPEAGTARPEGNDDGDRKETRPETVARYPRSMAAPGRDGALRRTFAALPPLPAPSAQPADQADRFAGTWWGNAWVTALEEGALDAARLARGRAYAGQGNVDALTVTPGHVVAYVQGSRPRPYRAQVRLRTFSDDEWDRFLDAAAERPDHIAALLDKQVPRSLAECGVRLLPGPGDLEPQCSCPDVGHPCKHAAAVCYQTARLLDQDPFVLLLLRGRGEREVLDALTRRNAARAARERAPAPAAGVRARDAVARRALPPLPAPLPPPAHPEQPPVYPGTADGPDPLALDQLATDAAARAHALLTTGHDPVADLTLWQDAVRLAAARPGSGLTAATRALYSSLAAATGRTPADLARAVAAWRQGGREGLAVLEEHWDPPAGRFDRARPLLLAADLPAFRPWHNHLTHPEGHTQLRLGRDGLWYAYESEPGREDWWPRGTPASDPVSALTGLGAPGTHEA